MITNLELIHFRNFHELTITFESGVNVLTGFNGQGKTNVLEAIYILSQTKSFRPGLPKDWIQINQDFTILVSEWENTDFQKLSWGFQIGKTPKIRIDNQTIKAVEHIGKIPLVCMNPEDVFLIQYAGTERRAWLNAWISQFNHEYLLQLIAWEKNIKQRNVLLEDYQISGKLDRNLLEIYDYQLINLGIFIHEVRVTVLQELNIYFQQFHNQLCSGQESVQLQLESSVNENTYENWKNQFDNSLERDKRTGRTNVGVHREDVEFKIHGKSLKLVGSQGQQKTFMIALKLSQLEYLKQQKCESLLLMDDIFDKMDTKRMNKVSEIILETQPVQVFITDTQEDRIIHAFSQQNIHLYQVENGFVKKK